MVAAAPLWVVALQDVPTLVYLVWWVGLCVLLLRGRPAPRSRDHPADSAGGIDTVRSSVSVSLTANLENLVLTGTAFLGTYQRVGEGAIGYRGHDRSGVAPLFPFGHGLSYSEFRYGTLKVTQRNGTIEVCVPVTNTSRRAGDEVVQLYTHQRTSRDPQPMLELETAQEAQYQVLADVLATAKNAGMEKIGFVETL